MSIRGVYKISRDLSLPGYYTGPLVKSGHEVEISDSTGTLKIVVRDQLGAVYIEGSVKFHDPKELSVYGQVTAFGTKICYVEAYVRDFGDHCYIFGFAATAGAADSGGQWDGNRPK